MPSVLLALCLALAGCGGGGSEDSADTAGDGAASKPRTPKIDPNEKIELLVWTREPTGPGTRGELLNKFADRFTEQHPNVSFKFVNRNYDTYMQQIKLAASSRTPPDVFEGNPGYILDATLIKAGLMRPMDDYAKALGWFDRYPPSAVAAARMTEDGKVRGEGPFWGFGATGELGGWFYNVQMLDELGAEVPKTLAEFEQLLEKSKAAGQTPIMLGNIDGWPATHVYNMIVDQTAPRELLDGIVLGREDARWDDPQLVEAADKLKSWADKGYFSKGYDALTQDDAVARFTKGQSLLLQCGSWCSVRVEEAMGKNAGYFLPPPVEEGERSLSTGSISAPYHISSRTEHEDAAALWIDYITSPDASREFAVIGELPGAPIEDPPYKPGSIGMAVFKAWDETFSNDKIVDYLDASTPNTGNVYYSGLQELLAGKATAQDVMTKIQEDREKYFKGLGVWE